MKKVFKQSLYVQVLAVLLIACTGDDGLDGLDAVAFSNQTKRGAVTLELTGKTSDGKDIAQKQVFAYSPTTIENTNDRKHK